jgi:diguanylate cyclase (GGDEF)-like protein
MTPYSNARPASAKANVQIDSSDVHLRIANLARRSAALPVFACNSLAANGFMSKEPGPKLLPLIDKALGEPGRFPALPRAIRATYLADFDDDRRSDNRMMILAFTALLDLFILPEFWSEPYMVPLSCLLRLFFYTPCVVLFAFLDYRGRLHRSYEPALLMLALAPCLIAAWLCALTVSVDAIANVRAMPLILLFTGLVWRMRLSTAVASAVLSMFILIAGAAITPIVPQAELPSLIITDIATCCFVIVFARRLEGRDRRVFLLTMNERIRRGMVASQNSNLLRESQTDSLTGLYNRRCFDETLSSLWLESVRSGTPIALLMIDVDHFKAFNDIYGHVVGDSCLRQVAERLRASVRATDSTARYGGEEFVVILPSADKETAIALAERARAAVAEMRLPHDGVGRTATVTISVGVATATPSDPLGARLLIEAADRNLYAAKRSGRNQVASSDSRAGTLQDPIEQVAHTPRKRSA